MKLNNNTFYGRLALTLIAMLGSSPLVGQTSRDELIDKSSIMFSGQVTEVAAASFSAVNASPITLVVKVMTVLMKPPSVSLKSGDNVTVEVKDATMFKVGTRANFYTIGTIFGEGLAVKEIGSEIWPGETKSKKTKSNLNVPDSQTVQQTKETLRLQKRIQGADLILTGRVTSIHSDLVASPEKGGRGEHDPAWQNAVVKVDSIIKGGIQPEEIIIRFSGSSDVAWASMPRFTEGQEGTFMLQTDRISGKPKAVLGGAEVITYLAPTLEDVLPKEAEARVRTLLK